MLLLLLFLLLLLSLMLLLLLMLFKFFVVDVINVAVVVFEVDVVAGVVFFVRSAECISTCLKVRIPSNAC